MLVELLDVPRMEVVMLHYFLNAGVDGDDIRKEGDSALDISKKMPVTKSQKIGMSFLTFCGRLMES